MYSVSVVIWQIIIFLFSAQTSAQSSNVSGNLTKAVIGFIMPKMTDAELESTAQSLSFIVRKSAHFAIYFVLGMLMYKAIQKCGRFKNKIAFSALFCMLYSVTDEIHQIFVPGRACRLFDIFVDCIGSILGIALVVFLTTIFEKWNKNKSSLV